MPLKPEVAVSASRSLWRSMYTVSPSTTATCSMASSSRVVAS